MPTFDTPGPIAATVVVAGAQVRVTASDRTDTVLLVEPIDNASKKDAKVADKTYFLVEAAQAGIFQIRNVPDADLDPILGIACANILFPYARETVADLIARAGFPPIHLAPVNFEAIYAARVEAQARTAEPRIEITH